MAGNSCKKTIDFRLNSKYWFDLCTKMDKMDQTYTKHQPSYFKILPSFSVDYKICKGVDDDPQAYLVPHPDDCTKFYSCQNLGWRGGYIAHLMDCPPTTGFDTNLRICNYIRALPRCNKRKSGSLFYREPKS